MPSTRAAPRPARRVAVVVRAQAIATRTVKIGTRGSPLAMAQAYLTRDLLKVRGGAREGGGVDGVEGYEAAHVLSRRRA
jgi:hypothetical protein